MATSSKFKINHDLLTAQQKEFTKGGALLRSVFSISARHPYLSIIFAIVFGVGVNAAYDAVSYPFVDDNFKRSVMRVYVGVVVACAVICTGVILWLRKLHKDRFVDVPLDQKKLLVTLVSKGRADFKDTPSYNTFKSLIYGDTGQAARNALEKVVLVVTELPEVVDTGTELKSFIENGNREAELYGITINNKSLREIQKQMELMLTKIGNDYPAHEVIVDYTGGTKDMSIALLRASEKALILPVYLNDATNGQHSKY